MMLMTMSMMIIRFSDNLMFPPQFNQTAPFMSIGIPGTVLNTIDNCGRWWVNLIELNHQPLSK